MVRRYAGRPALRRSQVLLVVLCGLAAGPARGDTPGERPATTMRDVEAQLKDCLQGFHEADGAQITVYFAVRRDGRIFGTPRAVWFGPGHANGDHRAILGDFLNSFEGCTPLRLSPRFAADIPGKVYYLQFRGHSAGADVKVGPYGSEGPPLIGDWWWW